MAAVEARRRRDPGPKDLSLVERERVRVAPRGGAEIAPPRVMRLVPAPQPVEVVVTVFPQATMKSEAEAKAKKQRFI